MTHTIDHLFEDNLVGEADYFDEIGGRDLNDSESEEKRDDDEQNDQDVDNPQGRSKKASEDDAEKKVKRVKRLQPKLNPERLMGPRGLADLPKAFDDFKFYGKGHEAEDLTRVLARIEHWAHRLYPKMRFDDFLEKVEKLGTKKVVQVYVKKLRMGLEDPVIQQVQSDEEAEDNTTVDTQNPVDEFDLLLAEQISQYQDSQPTPQTPANNFSSNNSPSTLTAEQKERMERNKKMAMEKRMMRLRAQQEQESQQLNIDDQQQQQLEESNSGQ